MTPKTQEAILAHALADIPRECCGLLISKNNREHYVPCRNVAEHARQFILPAEDWAAAEDMGTVVAVIHSHPNDTPNPSQADRVGCERSGIPWHIVSVPNESWCTITPEGYKAPLLGREFQHGVLDCYSLIRDYFEETFQVTLLDFPRQEEWWNKGDNLYMENFKKAGFFEIGVDELRVGDGIIMQIGSPVPNHAAVYLGDGTMLHHLFYRLSGREVYGGYYLKHTVAYVRHESRV